MTPCAPKMMANKVEIDKLNDSDQPWTAIITVEEKQNPFGQYTKIQKMVFSDEKSTKVEGIIFGMAVSIMGPRFQTCRKYRVSNAPIRLQYLRLSLWEEFHQDVGILLTELLQAKSYPTVVCRRMLISPYNGIEVTTSHRSVVSINPPFDKARKLRNWKEIDFFLQNKPSFSSTPGISHKNLSQITPITHIDDEQQVSSNVHDESGSIQASFFGSIVEKILGFTVTDIVENPEKSSPGSATVDTGMVMSVGEVAAGVDKWLKFAVENGVRELNLQLQPQYDHDYIVPGFILEAESLTMLSLHNCDFPDKLNIQKISCKNMRTLVLPEVSINDDTLSSLIAGCPLIEHLKINNCRDLNKVELMNNLNSLKEFEIYGYEYYRRKEKQTCFVEPPQPHHQETEQQVLMINAPNLASFDLGLYRTTLLFPIGLLVYPENGPIWMTNFMRFHEGNFNEIAKKKDRTDIVGPLFRRVIEDTLVMKRNCGGGISSFDLDMDYYYDDDDEAAQVDRWLKFAVENGVRELSVRSWPHYYVIPDFILETESVTMLSLHNCKFPEELKVQILCKNIRTLVLSQVSINDDTFSSLIAGCPLIEHLEINGCSDLSRVELVNNVHCVKKFDVYDCIARLKTLQSLTFGRRTRLNEAFFGNFLNSFPNVRSLVIRECHGFARMIH
ncbi:OLC1v1020154C1 [Oldenlandia corymbosa var. corymbosa]|uniref:OLC1v1020154C1 n=1 Tax=Oldenlandia corymbosa var. corymbosa TaxID=529605 RepID=A0AAV1EFN4_OLDCO|nr:OLC1v1020154C1 [Oldenlandia corymbosa var. corymbosa]